MYPKSAEVSDRTIALINSWLRCTA